MYITKVVESLQGIKENLHVILYVRNGEYVHPRNETLEHIREEYAFGREVGKLLEILHNAGFYTTITFESHATYKSDISGKVGMEPLIKKIDTSDRLVFIISVRYEDCEDKIK